MKGPHTPIAILSDETLFREGLRELLQAGGLVDIAEYSNSHDLIEAARSRAPALVLVDLDHEPEDVTTLIHQLRRALLGSQIVAIGSALRQAPVDGEVDGEVETPRSNTAALIAATRFMAPRRLHSAEARRQRRIWASITPRQREVLRWLATGVDNRTIATRLGVGERAVKAHVSTLLQTFGLKNRAQLSLLAHRAGFRPAPARARA
jgi:two-component system nitrate/nitrite response regulator NarP